MRELLPFGSRRKFFDGYFSTMLKSSTSTRHILQHGKRLSMRWQVWESGSHNTALLSLKHPTSLKSQQNLCQVTWQRLVNRERFLIQSIFLKRMSKHYGRKLCNCRLMHGKRYSRRFLCINRQLHSRSEEHTSELQSPD